MTRTEKHNKKDKNCHGAYDKKRKVEGGYIKLLTRKFNEIGDDRNELIRKRVARLVLGPSVFSPLKMGRYYKETLINELKNITLKQFCNFNGKNKETNFKKWFEERSESIADFIERKTGNKKLKIKEAHAPKILALYCRQLLQESWYEIKTLKKYKSIEKLLFVPIDSYVIKALKSNINKSYLADELKNDGKLIVHMSDLTEDQFLKIQSLLKKAAGKNIPPIWFDYVWADRDPRSRR